jgi:hypothetical protein
LTSETLTHNIATPPSISFLAASQGLVMPVNSDPENC